METQISLIAVFAAILGALLAIVRKNGKQAERLRAMRETAEREARERAKANEIIDNVRNMDDDDVRDRLRRISEGHKRNGLQ